MLAQPYFSGSKKNNPTFPAKEKSTHTVSVTQESSRFRNLLWNFKFNIPNPPIIGSLPRRTPSKWYLGFSLNPNFTCYFRSHLLSPWSSRSAIPFLVCTLLVSLPSNLFLWLILMFYGYLLNVRGINVKSVWILLGSRVESGMPF